MNQEVQVLAVLLCSYDKWQFNGTEAKDEVPVVSFHHTNDVLTVMCIKTCFDKQW